MSGIRLGSAGSCGVMAAVLGAAVSAVVMLAGCAGGRVGERGFVQREWAENLRELGMVPVFPPREDFRVGDVFVSTSDPDAAEAAEVLGKRWEQLNVAERERWLELGMGPRLWRLDVEEPEARQVAFPEFAAARVSGAAAAALVPVEALAVGFSVSAERAARVRVSVPAAESSTADAARVMESLMERGTGEPGRSEARVAREIHEAARWATGWATGGEDTPYYFLRVVTEVYAARAIDVSVATADGAGAQVGARPVAGPASAGAVMGGAAGALGGARSGCDDVGQTDSAAVWRRTAAEVERTLQAPGVRVRVLSLGESALTLRREFASPVAIGFRGVTLRVRRSDGAVVSGAVARTAVPQTVREETGE